MSTYSKNEPQNALAQNMDRRTLLKLGLATLTVSGTAPHAVAGSLTFCPSFGYVGDTIRVSGADFGVSAADVLVKIVGDHQTALLRPESQNGNDLLAVIVAVPPAMLGGQVEVVLGSGAFSSPANMPAGLLLAGPIWSWVQTNPVAIRSAQDFEFPQVTLNRCLTYWGQMRLGRLGVDVVVPYDQRCCPTCPAGSRITLRFCAQTASLTEAYAFDGTFITTADLLTSQVVDALCAMVVSAFESEHAVQITCQQTEIDPTRVNLTLGAPSGSVFGSGQLQVMLAHSQLPCDSYVHDSMANDSIPPDSLAGDPNEQCDSVPGFCDSMNLDFEPFLFN